MTSCRPYAIETTLSETAFFVTGGGQFHIRWFTPGSEVDLCGHATLASAFVLFTELEPARTFVRFASRSGPLEVSREGDLLCLDFPSRPPVQVPVPEGLEAALGVTVLSAWQSRDLVALLDSEADGAGPRARPDRPRPARRLRGGGDGQGVEADFVSRFFVPKQGIPEDPVTGSVHSTLVPFWAARLGTPRLRGLQVSARAAS